MKTKQARALTPAQEATLNKRQELLTRGSTTTAYMGYKKGF